MKTRENLSPGFLAYVAAVALAAAGLFATVPPDWSVVRWPDMAILMVLTFAAETFSVPMPNGKAYVSVGFCLVYAATLCFGAGAGAFLAAVAAIDWRELAGRIRPAVVLFNRSQLALSAGLAGLAFEAAGGTVGAPRFSAEILPVALGGAVYYAVNTLLMTFGLAVRERASPLALWTANFRWSAFNYLALLPVAVLLTAVYLGLGTAGLALFFLPLLAARHSFRLYLDMRQAYADTIASLAAALDAKDPYTAGHSRRVAEMAVRVGEAMGWKEPALDKLYYAGILHDIGKIGIDDAILKKSGRFTTEELAAMRLHPELGGRILEKVRFLRDVAPVVMYHHERWDGRGYPDGLRGEAIPIGARIIAVVDAFDAMISRRPYREGMSYEEARQEIVRNAGTQFDPAVVEAFLTVTAREEVRTAVLKNLRESANGTV
ncbi:MAG: HD-GYP domain-containing protein [Clostridia bacterium]|nr:HD-GYP domain-containing protein [Clostridia bacterium]